jgi:hypothetical protein
MAAWDELRTVLAELRERDPHALIMFPDPESDEDRQPPIEIELAAWAAHAAEQLHRRFGDQVTLTVGAMRYPQRTPARTPAPPVRAPTPLVDPRQARIAWAAPPRMRSGHSRRHEMAITNVGTAEISTSGPLIADIVDPDTGEIVGRYTGPITLGLITVIIPPGATRHIPVLVGTDSLRPDLGYAIPPGRWGAQTTLGLAGQLVRTPMLPITITA